jgi:hypothetical protein
VKIDRIYIAGCRLDVHFTQCCVASIRHWYPRIPISLIKDESHGDYSTEEMERYWDIDCFQTPKKFLGFGFGKLEPLFLPTGKRCLILDSDIVFIGKVLEVLEQYDEDFIVADTPNPPEETAMHYFDLAKLHGLDPEFVFPNYTFNSGQFVATTGIIRRDSFEPFLTFGDPPAHAYPDIFAAGEQGVLNFVLMKKFQKGSISLRREAFMWWAGWLDEETVKIENLTRNSPYPVLVHWAGCKSKTSFHVSRHDDIMRHFQSLYYSRIPRKTRAVNKYARRWLANAASALKQKWL